ncbi:MAG: DUF4345 domain-containing protein [Sphingorhabdus sp.]
MSRIFTRTVLAGSGAALTVIGGFIMFMPKIFLATSEVIVEHDAGLMSEVTAPSGLLIITGLFMMLSAVRLQSANMGLICGAVVYGSYGISRLISMDFHGIPSDTLIVVTYFEIAVAAILLALRLNASSAKWLNMVYPYFSQYDPSLTHNKRNK